METWWEILGLDAPISDLKAVKRAYAAKLKVTRPDDNPQGFMELRNAFEIAKQHVQFAAIDAEQTPLQEEDNNAFLHEDMRTETIVPDTKFESAGTAISEDNSELDSLPSTEPEYPPFYKEINAILDDASKRNNRQSWEQILASAKQYSIDEFIDFDTTLRHSLLARLGYYDDHVRIQNRNRERPFIMPFVATYLFKNMEWYKVDDRDYYVRQELEWLRRDMDVMKINRDPQKVRNTANVIETSEGTGVRTWIIIGSFIAGSQIIRLLLNAFGDASY